MRRLMAATLCGAMLLTACGKDKKNTESLPNSSSEPSVIQELELTDTLKSSSPSEQQETPNESRVPQDITGGVDTSALWVKDEDKASTNKSATSGEQLGEDAEAQEAAPDQSMRVDHSGLNLESVTFGEKYKSDPPEMNMVLYEGLTIPVLEGVTVHSDSDGLVMTSITDLLTVQPTAEVAINRDTLAFITGNAASFVEIKQAIISDKTVVGLVKTATDGVPSTQGLIYTLEGNRPLVMMYSSSDPDFSKVEQVAWAIVWKCPEIGWEPVPPHYTLADGKAEVSGVESTSWNAKGNYELPPMNMLTKDEIMWQVPQDWKVLDIGNNYSANSENGHLLFTVDIMKSNSTALADFSLQITQMLQNNQEAERVENFSELEDLYWEVVKVNNRIVWYKIYSTGEKVYRAVLSYDKTQATDQEKWIAEQVMGNFVMTGI